MADQIDATPRLSAPAELARAQAAASAAIPRPQEPARRSRVTHVPGLRRDRVASGVLVAWAALTTSLAVASLAVALVRPSENGVVSFDAWSWTPGPLVVASRPDGLETDDRVVAVDGVAIDRPLDVREGTHSYTVLRAGAERVVPVSVVSQPLLARIGGGWPVLLFAVGLAGLSALAWLRRPGVPWRRSFLVGAFANVASATGWELGVAPTDLARPWIFALSAFALPLYVLFWSSVIHVIAAAGPGRDPIRRRPALAALYLGPQLALVAGVLATRAMLPGDLAWIESWGRVVAVVLVLLAGGVIAATAYTWRALDAPRREQYAILIPTIVVTVAGVIGLSLVPTIVTGRPVVTRAGVAVLALPPLAMLALGVLRNRAFDVAVLGESRRRLIVAREDERRRLRRDLHDGLGPLLAGIGLKLEVAADFVDREPSRATALVAEARADTRDAVEEVRRIVRDLRPPALDEVGLVGALRRRAAELSHAAEAGDALDVTFETPDVLPPLPAAVEVAAYRIGSEAMTNALRHGKARQCVVRTSVDEAFLRLDIRDDGVGPDEAADAGVGTVSMQERARELGGTFELERLDGWTHVVATLRRT